MTNQPNTFGHNSLNELTPAAEAARANSDFIAKAMDMARAVPHEEGTPPPDVSMFTDDQEWRNAWSDEKLFDSPATPIAIEDPRTLLDNLTPADRKGIFMMYLREKFPVHARSDNEDFLAIEKASPAEMSKPEIRKHIRTFMALGKFVSNRPVELDDVQNSSVSTPEEVQRMGFTELYNRYINLNAGSPTVKALQDYTNMRKANEGISVDIVTNPQALAAALGGVSTPFAAALRHPEIFTQERLQLLEDKFTELRADEREVIAQATKQQTNIKNRIDRKENRTFKEAVYENFSGLEGWQKLVVIGIGSYFAWRAVRSNKNNIDKFIIAPAIAISAFYLSGARDMLKGTAVESLIKPLENGANSAFRFGKDKLGNLPTVNEQDLEEYSEYFTEVAKEDLGTQIESMSYMSQVDIASIANSFELNDGARGGHMNLDRNSALSKAVIDELGEGAGHMAVSRMKGNNEVLSDSMAHVFYMLGGSESLSSMRQIDKYMSDNGLESYDQIPDGAAERALYEKLAARGVKLAKTKYAGQNWISIVSQFLDPKYVDPHWTSSVYGVGAATPGAIGHGASTARNTSRNWWNGPHWWNRTNTSTPSTPSTGVTGSPQAGQAPSPQAGQAPSPQAGSGGSPISGSTGGTVI